MSTSTPQMVPLNLVTGLITELLKMVDDARAKVYRISWDVGIQILIDHWLSIALILLLLLTFSTLWAFTTRRWGLFGSVLYHYFYFGLLLILGSIWGPEIFAKDYFDVILVLLYPICYLLVRSILKETGLRRY